MTENNKKDMIKEIASLFDFLCYNNKCESLIKDCNRISINSYCELHKMFF